MYSILITFPLQAKSAVKLNLSKVDDDFNSRAISVRSHSPNAEATIQEILKKKAPSMMVKEVPSTKPFRFTLTLDKRFPSHFTADK